MASIAGIASGAASSVAAGAASSVVAGPPPDEVSPQAPSRISAQAAPSICKYFMAPPSEPASNQAASITHRAPRRESLRFPPLAATIFGTTRRKVADSANPGRHRRCPTQAPSRGEKPNEAIACSRHRDAGTESVKTPLVNTPRLIRIFVEHRLASNLAMALMVLAGAWAISQLNVQLNPDQPPRFINVSIAWRGAAAEDVEKLVTTPVEQQLRTLGEIRTLRSYTGNGYTNVSARLEVDADVGQAVEKIRQRVANMQSLPANIEPPQVAVSEWNELVASVLITGPKTTEEIAPLARRFERELLASGADKVEISGLPAEEIAIQVNSRTLYELGLSLDQLAERISRASQDAPGGRIGRGQEAQQLRSLGQRRSADEFADLIVFNDVNGRSMRLGDIATVTKRPRVDQPYTMMNGLPAVSLDVLRDVETDSLTAAEHLRNWLSATEGKLTEGVSLQLFQEAWRYIADEITIILGNGLGGLMLVIVVLMVFLHGRVAFWVMVGIPVTFLAALLGFYYAGGTINLISIIGMVMALGIVVDDAIVVGEEALTQHQRGLSATDAAAAGASRMFAPVVASSITTLCAFAPIVVMAAAEGGGNIMEIPMVMLFM
ncbi:MAG: efflux RND transporter permease subunit, partial [Gammaproteobacteria bacterium]|nr:efflux RND transporter permease subunit [Gammaproteobacteria bacterium]